MEAEQSARQHHRHQIEHLVGERPAERCEHIDHKRTHPMCFIELTTRLFHDVWQMEIKGHTLRTVASIDLLQGHGPGPHDNDGSAAWPPMKK